MPTNNEIARHGDSVPSGPTATAGSESPFQGPGGQEVTTQRHSDDMRAGRALALMATVCDAIRSNETEINPNDGWYTLQLGPNTVRAIEELFPAYGDD